MIMKIWTAIETIRWVKGGVHPRSILRTSFLTRILPNCPCEPILNFNKQQWNSELDNVAYSSENNNDCENSDSNCDNKMREGRCSSTCNTKNFLPSSHLYRTATFEPILNFNKQLWNSELYCWVIILKPQAKAKSFRNQFMSGGGGR